MLRKGNRARGTAATAGGSRQNNHTLEQMIKTETVVCVCVCLQQGLKEQTLVVHTFNPCYRSLSATGESHIQGSTWALESVQSQPGKLRETLPQNKFKDSWEIAQQ